MWSTIFQCFCLSFLYFSQTSSLILIPPFSLGKRFPRIQIKCPCSILNYRTFIIKFLGCYIGAGAGAFQPRWGREFWRWRSFFLWSKILMKHTNKNGVKVTFLLPFLPFSSILSEIRERRELGFLNLWVQIVWVQ